MYDIVLHAGICSAFCRADAEAGRFFENPDNFFTIAYIIPIQRDS